MLRPPDVAGVGSRAVCCAHEPLINFCSLTRNEPEQAQVNGGWINIVQFVQRIPCNIVTADSNLGYRMLNFNNFSLRGGSNGAHEMAVNGKGYCLP